MQIKEAPTRSRVIVHADDFGLSNAINDGIIAAYDRGILTSTSLVANGIAIDSAIELAKARPDLDVGFHLCLTEEEPVCPRREIPTLVGNNGAFHKSALRFATRYMMGRVSIKEVKRETERQLETLLSAGLCLSHIDSHQHVHTIPAIYDLIQSTAHKYQIPFVRTPKERFSAYMIEGGNLRRLMETMVLHALCTLSAREETPRFAGFYYGGKLNRERLTQLLQISAASGTTEIMCHPGYHCERYVSWGYDHASEMNALIDADIAALVAELGIELVGFKDLVAL